MTDTTQNGGGEQPVAGNAADAALDSQVTDNAAEGAEGGEEGQPQKQWQAPTEAEWRQYQKDQQATQRRFNKRTAEMHAALRRADELEKRMAALEKARSEPKDEEPSPDQFNNWSDYQKKLTEWQVKQHMKATQAAQDTGQSSAVPPAQEAAWLQQREQEAVQQAQQLAQHIPDFAESISAAADLVDAMPWQTRKALYDSPHPALAAYVLEKQGVLPDLMNATPQQAAYIVQQATQLGIQNIKSWAAKQPGKSQPTGAPQPMTPNKGTGPGAKSEDRMSGNELLKKYGVS